MAKGVGIVISGAGHEHTDLRCRPEHTDLRGRPRAHRRQGPATSTPTSEAGHEHTDLRGRPPRAHRLQGPATSTWRPAGTRTGSRQPDRAVAATPVARVLSAPVARFAPRLGDGRAVARRTRASWSPTRRGWSARQTSRRSCRLPLSPAMRAEAPCWPGWPRSWSCTPVVGHLAGPSAGSSTTCGLSRRCRPRTPTCWSTRRRRHVFGGWWTRRARRRCRRRTCPSISSLISWRAPFGRSGGLLAAPA